PWRRPVNLGPPINTEAFEGAPCLSADGLELYFMSNRSGGGYDLWVSKRATRKDTWATPVNLGPNVNSSADENGPSISADGLELYFSDHIGGDARPGGRGGRDIWVTRRKSKNEPWGTAVNLGPPINTWAHEASPSISRDELSLYFVSEHRLGNFGSTDIWVAKRKSKNEPWGPPTNLGPIVNSVHSEYNPDISSDGSTLYFVSGRPGNIGSSDTTWDSDIWYIVLEKTAQTSSLQSGAFVGDLAKVKALLDAGADVNEKNATGMTALYAAAVGGHKKVVELLLSKGADPNTWVGNQTILFWAAGRGHKETVEALLAHGANVNLGNKRYNRTPVEVAMSANHNEVVKLLLDNGAEIPPLHLALYMKDQAKARNLIQSGADVNERTPYGVTPLREAVHAGLIDIAELLISKGADVNAKTNYGWTPLHGAVFRSKDMVELLIKSGADVNVKHGAGETPLDIAMRKRNTEIVELLRKHGAKE
ncbi:MAG: ankyrin repeat domain-containing protein, partial [Planctomycetota bacterium]